MEKLKDNVMFEKIDAVAPGFINIILSPAYIVEYMNSMAKDERFGCPEEENKKLSLIHI